MKIKQLLSVLLTALMMLIMPMMVLADGESAQSGQSAQSGASEQPGESGGSGSSGGGDDNPIVGARYINGINGISPSNGGNVYLGGLKWCVIGESTDRWLLISADVLNSPCNWNNAKKYCEDVFKSGDGKVLFSFLEKNAVINTSKEERFGNSNFKPANLSNASLFLLSAAEFEYYSKENGDLKSGSWWLRSPYYHAYVSYAGVVRDGILYNDRVINDFIYGVRPAFQLNRTSVLFTSAAEGGKPSVNSGFRKYTEPTTAVDRKLTLIDSDRSGFTANVLGTSSTTVAPGGSLAVSYSGAGTGDGEYVSAMLCDANGNVMYYASLTPDSSGSGTWNMTIPAELSEGSYTLKMFREQQNGDYQTDYASVPTEIALTVDNNAAMTYAVNTTVTPAEGGSVTASPGVTTAKNNVTLTVTPAAGYELDTLTVKDANDSSITVDNNQFTMPASNVTVKATFKELTEPVFRTQSLLLSGQIGVNFFMDLSVLSSGELETSYMTFDISGNGTTTDRDSFDVGFKNATGTYYGFTCYVNSIQMADTITATFHYGNDKEISKTYSVKEYLTFFDTATGFDQKTINLIHAIADYGHYAQPFLAAANGWSLETDYAEMDVNYAKSYKYDNIIGVLNQSDSSKAFSKAVNSSMIESVTYSLSLDSDTALNVFIKPVEGCEVTASTTFNGKKYTAVKQSDGRYLLRIPGISAHLLGDMAKITGTAIKGSESSNIEIHVSALSYVLAVLQHENGDNVAYGENAKNAMAALYNYYASTMAYRNKG